MKVNKRFGRLIPIIGPVLLICFLVSVASAQSNPQTAPESDARKAFEKLKTLAGSWEGSIGELSTQLTIRVTSGGSAILHDALMATHNKITMIYLEGDHLYLTHYADDGNHPRLEGKLLPDGNRVEFSTPETGGITQKPFMKRAMFIMIGPDRHGIEVTYILPNGKSVEARGEFQRTK
jgi:hypothetical protein